MSTTEYLIDTNILIYHTKGLHAASRFIDEDIAKEAIDLKRRGRIKLADAVIAATALVNNLKLATRNVDDYKAVKHLEIFNPFA